MRRSEKEIRDIHIIEDIISRAQVCRMAMCYDTKPYIVPVNFGYKDMTFYVHSSKIGKKIDIIHKNPNVMIEIDEIIQLVTGELACDYTMHFKSVLAEGIAEIITKEEEKVIGLDIIMSQYSKEPSFTYSQKAINAVSIIKICVTNMTGKQTEDNE